MRVEFSETPILRSGIFRDRLVGFIPLTYMSPDFFDIQSNPHNSALNTNSHPQKSVLAHAVSPYADQALRKEYQDELVNPRQRLLFRSLLLAGMCRVPFGTTTRTAQRISVIPVDSLQLFPPGITNPTTEDFRHAGRRLSTILTTNQLAALCSNTLQRSDESVGRAYFDARTRAMDAWNHSGNLQTWVPQNDPAFSILIRTPIEQYRRCRETLNACLNEFRIPTLETIEMAGTETHLSLREYLGLLSLIWAGSDANMRAAAARGTTGLRLLLLNESALIRPSQDVFERLVAEGELDTASEQSHTVSVTMSADEVRAYEQGFQGIILFVPKAAYE